MAEDTFQNKDVYDNKVKIAHDTTSELKLNPKRQKMLVYKEDGTLQTCNMLMGNDIENEDTQQPTVVKFKSTVQKHRKEISRGLSYEESTSERDCHKKGRKHTFLCTACNISFYSEGLYAQHKLKKHHLYICSECLEDFDSENRRNEHKQRVHEKASPCVNNNKTISVNTLKTYYCSVCNKTLKSSSALKYHRQSHHFSNSDRQSMNKCDVCDKVFTSSHGLTLHRSVHTGEKPYKCPEKGCGKSFRLQGTFMRHQQMHAGIKSFVCSECGEAFSQGDYLKSHMYKHTGKKSFQCNLCDKSFCQKGNLTVHMNIHKTERQKLTCKWCEQSYFYKSYLTKHEKHCRTMKDGKSSRNQDNKSTNTRHDTERNKNHKNSPIVVRMVPYKVIVTETGSGKAGTILVPLNSQSAALTTVSTANNNKIEVTANLNTNPIDARPVSAIHPNPNPNTVADIECIGASESSPNKRKMVSLVNINHMLTYTRDISCDEDSADLDVTSNIKLSETDMGQKQLVDSIEDSKCESEGQSSSHQAEKKGAERETVESQEDDGEHGTTSQATTVNDLSRTSLVNKYTCKTSVNTMQAGQSLLRNIPLKTGVSTCRALSVKTPVVSAVPIKPKEQIQLVNADKKFPSSFLSVPSNASTKVVYVPMNNAYRSQQTPGHPYKPPNLTSFPVTRQLLNPSHLIGDSPPLVVYPVRKAGENPPPYHAVISKPHSSSLTSQMLGKPVDNNGKSIFIRHSNVPCTFVNDSVNRYNSSKNNSFTASDLNSMKQTSTDVRSVSNNPVGVVLSKDEVKNVIFSSEKNTCSEITKPKESAEECNNDISGNCFGQSALNDSGQFVMRVSDINNVEEVLKETIYSSAEIKPASEVVNALEDLGNLYNIEDHAPISTGQPETVVRRDSMVHDISDIDEFLV